MYIRKILLSSIIGACVFGILSGCAPIVPAPTIDRVIVPISKDSPRVYQYRVRSGDTLYAISRLHGISVDQIAQMNDIAAPYVIHPGQRLFVDHKLIAVESTTSVEGTEGEPDTPIASVATRDGSSTSVNTSTPASSGITVTKLPRPPKRAGGRTFQYVADNRRVT